jgi:hypothetical protein
VLLGVEKQQLERLYQQHIAEEDYLEKVGKQVTCATMPKLCCIGQGACCWCMVVFEIFAG